MLSNLSLCECCDGGSKAPLITLHNALLALSFCCILLCLSRGLQCYLWYVADANLGVGLGQKCWIKIWTCLLGLTSLSAKVGLSVSLPFMPIWLWWLMHVELCCTLKSLGSEEVRAVFTWYMKWTICCKEKLQTWWTKVTNSLGVLRSMECLNILGGGDWGWRMKMNHIHWQEVTSKGWLDGS